MKKYLVVLAVITIVIAMVGGAYAGSTDATVGLSSTVSAKCVVGASGSTLTFLIDPSVSGPIAATLNHDTTVNCTKSAPYTITALSAALGGSAASCTGAGYVGKLDDGTNSLPYTVTCANGSGAGFGSGTARNLSLAATVASTDYVNLPVTATPSDTLTLTINY